MTREARARRAVDADEEGMARSRSRVWKWIAVVLGITGATAGLALFALATAVILAFSSLTIGPCEPISFKGSDRTDCARSPHQLVRGSVLRRYRKKLPGLVEKLDPNLPDATGNRPLACAALVGNLPAVRLLLDAGARATDAGENGGRPIVAAVSGEGREGNEAATDGVIFTPLDSPDRLAIVRLLVAHGADPTSALSPAIEKENTMAAEGLLAAGADPDGEDDGPSPLVTALYAGDAGIVDLLLAHGADVDHGGSVSYTDASLALVSAAMEGGKDLPNPVFPPRGPGTTLQVTDPPVSGEVPPLLAAVLYDHHTHSTAMVAKLLAAGADPNRPAFDEFTAIWVAAFVDDVPIAFVLKAHGAIVDPQGLESGTAMAKARKDPELIALFAS